MTDPYEILGVSPNATPEEIRRQYKTLAMQWHPDRNKEEGADAKFKEISHAFDKLTTGSVLPPVINYQVPEKDEIVDIFVTIKDLREGCNKRIEFELPERCKSCQGCGREEHERCSTCAGSGRISVMQIPGLPFMLHIPMGRPCIACNGVGVIPRTHEHCRGPCKGSGRVYEKHQYNIRIPAGVANDHVNALRDRVLVRIRHAFETGIVLLDNGDLMYTMELTLEDVLCGFDRVIELSHTGIRHVVSAQYRDPTEPIVLKGDGAKIGTDLIVHFRVIYPKNIGKYTDIFKRIFAGGKII